jgi:hypothetical protein
MPGGLSPAERYEKLAGSLGTGIWKQAPTPGGNCPKGIYHPKPYTTFQYLLNSRIDIRAPLVPGIETYIIDMFETTKEDIDALHRQGRKAICYFNAGGSQEGNPDNGEFLAKDKGGRISKDNGGGYWPGEVSCVNCVSPLPANQTIELGRYHFPVGAEHHVQADPNGPQKGLSRLRIRQRW